ncbi:hypothetical protein [Tenacibaculum sp. SDUM215027]|uniref:hypothetical protein n=1 Tax=Tenacibaculum sp. SDUM215027 TaxID=3422596 RepID=UPI003D31B6C9
MKKMDNYTEKELLDKIENFRPENDDFTPLENLFNEFYDKFLKTNTSNKVIVTLFKVLERFSEVSEPNVFWNIMYSLEDMDGFEQEYVNSLKRKTSDITIMNLNALFNSNITYVGNEKMEDLLDHIINNPNTSSSTVKYIKEEFVKIEKKEEKVRNEIELKKKTSDKNIKEKSKKWWKF